MAPIEVSVKAYRPEDIEADAPRRSIAALFSLGRTTIFAGFDQKVLVAAARPVPLRRWAQGTLGGKGFAGLNGEATLFAGASSQGGGALLGL